MYKLISMSAFLIFSACLVNQPAMADRIILKDGTVELSDRVWESEKYVHFILKGTNSVEIRYEKRIVERIEHQNSDKPDQKAVFSEVNPSETGGGPPAPLKPPVTSIAQKVSTAPKKISPTLSVNSSEHKMVRENSGILFYDPKRPRRYWASRQSKHLNLKNALKALSELYDRPTEWIEAHMGDENDLGKIHANLMQAKNNTAVAADTRSDVHNAAMPAEIKKENEFSELSAKDTAHKDGPYRQVPESGIKFYDPRRPEKYWSDRKTHQQTYEQAVEALANHYHVSPAWVYDHMGDTNDLGEIHQNIQRNLPPD